jgi:hypothetical protein
MSLTAVAVDRDAPWWASYRAAAPAAKPAAIVTAMLATMLPLMTDDSQPVVSVSPRSSRATSSMPTRRTRTARYSM